MAISQKSQKEKTKMCINCEFHPIRYSETNNKEHREHLILITDVALLAIGGSGHKKNSLITFFSTDLYERHAFQRKGPQVIYSFTIQINFLSFCSRQQENPDCLNTKLDLVEGMQLAKLQAKCLSKGLWNLATSISLFGVLKALIQL